MRMRKSKEVDKIVKGRVGEIGKRLKGQGKENSVDKGIEFKKCQNDSEQKATKSKKTKSKIVYNSCHPKTPEPKNIDCNTTINSLINTIYTQFLSEVVGNKPSLSSLLPLISKSLVRLSDNFMVEEVLSTNQASLHKSANNNLGGFADFIVQEVMCYQLLNGKEKVVDNEEFVRRIVDRELV